MKKYIVIILTILLLLGGCEKGEKSYLVNFDTDGGSFVPAVTVKEGESLSKPEDPLKDGYVFVEWQLDGKSFDFSTNISKDTTLKAVYKEKETVNDIKDDDKEIIYSAEMTMNRQHILDEGCIVGIMYLGYCDGPIGDGIIDVIQGTDYVTDRPYLMEIPYDQYVEGDGHYYYCILPLSDDSSVAVNRGDEVLYRNEHGSPIILICDDKEVEVTVVDGDDVSVFSFSLQLNGELDIVGDLVKDISIY